MNVGLTSEMMVISHLVSLGKTVLRPIGDTRYDLVVDDQEQFIRVQVKTARLIRGVLMCGAESLHRKYRRKSYIGQVDILAMYSRETKKPYFVSLRAGQWPCGSVLNLRLAPPGRCVQTNMHFAKDFEDFNGAVAQLGERVPCKH
jgi:hypothetical protein